MACWLFRRLWLSPWKRSSDPFLRLRRRTGQKKGAVRGKTSLLLEQRKILSLMTALTSLDFRLARIDVSPRITNSLQSQTACHDAAYRAMAEVGPLTLVCKALVKTCDMGKAPSHGFEFELTVTCCETRRSMRFATPVLLGQLQLAP